METLKAWESAVVGKGVDLRLITDRSKMESVLEYVTEGNRAQMRDPAFVAELKHWIRFNESQAVSTGDGLFTGSSGNPTSPSWRPAECRFDHKRGSHRHRRPGALPHLGRSRARDGGFAPEAGLSSPI